MNSVRPFLGVALATLAAAHSLDAQRAPRRPAPRTAQSTQPSARSAVVVLPVDGDRNDSVRTILQRDLDLGSRLTPTTVPRASLATLVPGDGATPDLPGLARFRTRYVVQARRTTGGLHVVAYDVRGPRSVGERRFVVPQVPSVRPEALRDSLTRLYQARWDAAQAQLAALALRRDSLLRVSTTRLPRGEAGRVESARRDSLTRFVQASDSGLRVWLSGAIAERDSLIAVAIARDSIVRDSLVYAERMALHAAADEVHSWLTGRRGIAASRIAFVRDSLLFVIDSDGANQRQLTRTGRAISPSWHPSGRYIAFSDLADAGTQIAEVDLATGEIRILSATPRGLNLTPVYTPDGSRIVYASGTENSGTQLVSVSRTDSIAVPLGGPLSDASSPSFAPGGDRLAYIAARAWSGRGASARMTPQIFVSTLDGTVAEQLTPSAFGVRSYRTSPDWSPDGEYVAYMQQAGDFQVWLIGLRDRRMRRLTTSAENEDPAWGPDSRHIAMASNRGGTREIWVMDVETRHMRQLTHAPGARLPAWSPPWRTEQPVVVQAGN